MKHRMRFILPVILGILCAISFCSCDITAAAEDMLCGGMLQDWIGNGESLWSPEDITEGEIVDNNSGSVAEGRLYFHKSHGRALLLDDFGGLTWLYAEDPSMFRDFDTGDRVKISHGGVMLSYPAQTNISKIALIEDGDESDFTDEELEMIIRVLD